MILLWMTLFCTLSFAQNFNLTNHSDCIKYAHQPVQKVSERKKSLIKTAYCNPLAIYASENYSFILEVERDDINQLEVQNNFLFANSVLQNNSQVDFISFRDDGKLNDIKAGDRIFTASNISFRTGTFFDILTNTMISADVKLMTKTGNNEAYTNESINLILRVKPARFKTPVIKKINSSAQHSEYVLNLVTDGSKPLEDPTVIKEYYKYFKDDRDFIVHTGVFTTFMDKTKGTSGIYSPVSNSISGLSGKPKDIKFDNSANYGSKGILQGVISTFNDKSFENWLITHELTHRWALYTDPSLAFDIGSHWGGVFLGSSGFGWNEVQSITPKSNNSIIVKYGRSTNFFNQVELYLMGLIPIDSLKFPYTVYEGAAYVGEEADGSLIQYTKIKTVTKSDFLSVMNLRSPSVSASQKNFKMGCIVSSPRLLTAEELAFFDNKVKEYEQDTLPSELNWCNTPAFRFDCGNNNFNIAAQGKAKLTTRLATFENSTPINENTLEGITVYPNPAHRLIRIKGLDQMKHSISYQILDLMGKEIQNGILSHSEIVLKNNTAGVFILKLTNKEKRAVKVIRLVSE